MPSTETLKASIGGVGAGLLEPVIRGATELIKSFLALPAPIQKTVIASTAFVTVLGGAVAALTAYNLVNGKAITQEIAASAAQVKRTVATTSASCCDQPRRGCSKPLTLSPPDEQQRHKRADRGICSKCCQSWSLCRGDRGDRAGGQYLQRNHRSLEGDASRD
jgi:hypothetical protein